MRKRLSIRRSAARIVDVSELGVPLERHEIAPDHPVTQKQR
jgi:hypothetical protein